MSAKYLKLGFGIVAIAALIIVPMNFNRYGLFILSQWAVMTIAAMGLNLTLGYAGQVSLGQVAFYGLGAYTSTLLFTRLGTVRAPLHCCRPALAPKSSVVLWARTSPRVMLRRPQS